MDWNNNFEIHKSTKWKKHENVFLYHAYTSQTYYYTTRKNRTFTYEKPNHVKSTIFCLFHIKPFHCTFDIQNKINDYKTHYFSISINLLFSLSLSVCLSLSWMYFVKSTNLYHGLVSMPLKISQFTVFFPATLPYHPNNTWNYTTKNTHYSLQSFVSLWQINLSLLLSFANLQITMSVCYSPFPLRALYQLQSLIL